MKNNQFLSSRKVAIIGAGYVGASIAYALIIKGIVREIVMIEQPEFTSKCEAEVNDIRHGIPYMGSSNIYCGEYKDIRDCELIILTMGRNRTHGESRLDMALDNVKIAYKAAEQIISNYNNSIILIVSNPVDIITTKMTGWLNLPYGRVFGTGCILDSSRLTNILADYVKMRPDVVSANVIGEHGDGQIALWSKSFVAGMPISEYCAMMSIPLDSQKRIEIEQSVIRMGTQIISGKGRTHYGIATCVCYIADSILNRRPTVVSVSSVINGQYGITDIALSLPSIVGGNGVEKVFDEKLNDFESNMLNECVEKLNTTLLKVNRC